MPPKKTVSGKALLTDIRAGMTDSELMQKYQMSENSLKSAFKKLLEVGALTEAELTVRYALLRKTTDEKPTVQEQERTVEDQPQQVPKGEESGQSLLRAAHTGNLAAIMRLVEQNVDLNVRDHYGATPLILAAQKGHKEIVSLLLESGANYHLADSTGRSAVSWATAQGYPEINELFLMHHIQKKEKGRQDPSKKAKGNEGKVAELSPESESPEKIHERSRAQGPGSESASELPPSENSRRHETHEDWRGSEGQAAPAIESTGNTISENLGIQPQHLSNAASKLLKEVVLRAMNWAGIFKIVLITTLFLSASMSIMLSSKAAFLAIYAASGILLVGFLTLGRSFSQHEFVSLPSTFLELDAVHRKRSLDLAWRSVPEEVAVSTFRTVSTKVGIVVSSSFMGLFGLLFLASVGLHVELAKNELDISSFSPLLSYSLAYASLYISLRINEKASRALARRLGLESYEDQLRLLSATFVRNQYQNWFSDVRAMGLYQATNTWNVTPEHTFLLTSNEGFPLNFWMPYRVQRMTFIFSNGYVSVISNVKWDVYATTYSLVGEDAPSYCLSDPGTWSTEEFHYRDVVEVTYVPGPQTVPGQENFFTKVLKQQSARMITNTPQESEPPAEGYLVLGLVNGQRKEYPTGRDAVASFLTVARERVRVLKMS